MTGVADFETREAVAAEDSERRTVGATVGDGSHLIDCKYGHIAKVWQLCQTIDSYRRYVDQLEARAELAEMRLEAVKGALERWY